MINVRFDDRLYRQHCHRLIATWANDRIAIGSLPNGGVGRPSLLWQQFAYAIIANTLNNPDIKNKVHYIRPDGNSEQFRKGAW